MNGSSGKIKNAWGLYGGVAFVLSHKRLVASFSLQHVFATATDSAVDLLDLWHGQDGIGPVVCSRQLSETYNRAVTCSTVFSVWSTVAMDWLSV